MGRYDDSEKHQVTDWSGRTISVTKFSIRAPGKSRGRHLRRQGERLDHLAHIYLQQSDAGWAFVDLNQTMGVESLNVQKSLDVPEDV